MLYNNKVIYIFKEKLILKKFFDAIKTKQTNKLQKLQIT